MKKVFSSNSQLCHIWAQQTQSEGRGNNLFFEGNKIWSYGYHFLAAQIHTIKGKKICLVNEHRYSPSTGRHLYLIEGAVHGLMPSFRVPDVSNPKKGVKYLDDLAQAEIDAALKVMKVDHKGAFAWKRKRIEAAFKEASDFRLLLGLKSIKPKKSDLDAVRAHFEARFKRYKELNTPEMQAKREAERIKRDARKAKLEAEKQAETIEKFRRGENVYLDLPHELLRIQGEEIVTSRGARVPLKEAVALFNQIESGEKSENLKGAEVGNFHVTAVYSYPDSNFVDDKLIYVGCHRIRLSEARQVLTNARHLSLVS